MDLPQGYDQRPFGYVGDLYTASQMTAYRHAAIEETEMRLCAQIDRLQNRLNIVEAYLTPVVDANDNTRPTPTAAKLQIWAAIDEYVESLGGDTGNVPVDPTVKARLTDIVDKLFSIRR